MLVANSFDLWQKDTFFSAAEEVQQSADIMESAYRAWLRARKEGLISHHLDKLNRELQMALGTAKWQLEEFERAVCLSYRNNGDDITITRHREFVSAMEEQISRVETALKELLKVEGKKPFRWVNLDEEECHELAHFISGTPGTSQIIKDDCLKVRAAVANSLFKSNVNEDFNFGYHVSPKMQIPDQDKSSEEGLTSIKDINGFTELHERKKPETWHEISYQADQPSSNQTAWSLPDRNILKIVIDNDRQMNGLAEATGEEKGSEPFIRRSRGGVYHRAKEMQSNAQMKLISWINHHLRAGQKNQRQRISPVLPVKSIRFVLALMLTIFLLELKLDDSLSLCIQPRVWNLVRGEGFFSSTVDIYMREGHHLLIQVKIPSFIAKALCQVPQFLV